MYQDSFLYHAPPDYIIQKKHKTNTKKHDYRLLETKHTKYNVVR